MNVVLLVVDSLRAKSLAAFGGSGTHTPFLDGLEQHALRFARAHATECWTLPTHASMFTGLMPSEHGAHFQSMAYEGARPTIAEVLREAGYVTEVISRNPIFDGRLPGITRGFERNTRVYAPQKRLDPLAIGLALSKPRFRRQVRDSGFFNASQRENLQFIVDFGRSTVPADRPALDRVLEAMEDGRQSGKPTFLFCNLFDVHAPYCPSEDSLVGPIHNVSDLIDNVVALQSLPKTGSHSYLKEGFTMSDRGRTALLSRYQRAIELMDAKLADFYAQARAGGLLDDTLLILTSDHGEAFGEHALYLHDASVWQDHLHVPLWIHGPGVESGVVDDIVSTRDLFMLMLAAGGVVGWEETLLREAWRAQNPYALAEHFYYPHIADMKPEYRRNQLAVVSSDQKLIVTGEEARVYDLASDPDETQPVAETAKSFMQRFSAAGPSAMESTSELERFLFAR